MLYSGGCAVGILPALSLQLRVRAGSREHTLAQLNQILINPQSAAPAGWWSSESIQQNHGNILGIVWFSFLWKFCSTCQQKRRRQFLVVLGGIRVESDSAAVPCLLLWWEAQNRQIIATLKAWENSENVQSLPRKTFTGFSQKSPWGERQRGPSSFCIMCVISLCLFGIWAFSVCVSCFLNPPPLAPSNPPEVKQHHINSDRAAPKSSVLLCLRITSQCSLEMGTDSTNGTKQLTEQADVSRDCMENTWIYGKKMHHLSPAEISSVLVKLLLNHSDVADSFYALKAGTFILSGFFKLYVPFIRYKISGINY